MILHRISRDQSGASAAEFALVLPLLLILLFGIIDAGRWMWTYNEAEKATQMGARYAVVAASISGDSTVDPPTGIYSSYISSTLIQGDVIPAAAFGKVTCTGTGSGTTVSATCTCTATPCPGGATTANNTAFQNVYNRMQSFLPQLKASNVQVEYSSSGLGYAGSPVLPDLSPLVTVKITNMTFKPITTLTLASMTMPNFTTTLTAEDLSGAVSN